MNLKKVIFIILVVSFVLFKCNQLNSVIVQSFPDSIAEWNYTSIEIDSDEITINATNQDAGYNEFKFTIQVNIFSVSIVECSIVDESGHWTVLFSN